MESSRSKYRIALWVLVPVLAIGALAVPRALAFRRGHHHHASSAAELKEHLEEGLDALLDRVDATDAQRAQANALAARRSPELFALIQEGRALRTKLKNSLLAEQVDSAAVDRARAELQALTAKASEIGLVSMVELAQLLTPAQRKEIADKLARFER